MATDQFNLKQILAIAKLHPFYNENATYPTSREEAYRIAEKVKKDDSEKIDLTSVPLATKDTLYVLFQEFSLKSSSAFLFQHCRLCFHMNMYSSNIRKAH